MNHNKLFIAMLAATAVLTAGCNSGDEGDDVNINIEQTTDDTGTDGGDDGGSTGGTGNLVEADFVSYNEAGTIGTITGTINEDFTFTSGLEWRLDGTVLVGTGNEQVSSAADVQAVKDAGVVLTIEAGTNVRAFDDGALIVTRGSQIIADGTAASPITFSSVADDDYDGLGEWGGIIVQGFAPQYGQGGTGACYGANTWCNVEGEGGTEVAVYGGNEPDDNSGILRYVRIAEGGLVAGPNNEINGLTLQGVGYGTTIDYIQVHNNLDDGVEWFGGTVDVKHLVLTGNDDDDIDFDEGYQGNIQYAIIEKNQDKDAPEGSNDPRGIEANSSDEDYTAETNAVLANVTLVGGAMNNNDASAEGAQPGYRLRGGLTVSIYNSSIDNFDSGCIRIDDADTNGDSTADVMSNVTLTNILNDCAGGIYTHETADTEVNVIEASLSYSGTYAINESEAVLASAPAIVAANTGSGFVFDQTAYVGAVDPAATSGWWEGWIIPGSLASATPNTDVSFVTCDTGLTTCTLAGTIDEDYRLTAGVEWRLDGEVIVGTGNAEVTSDADVATIIANGVTLTIDPGVEVRAFDDGSLIVTRGSKLEAQGTPASPITFSSLADDNYDGEGEWGGVIIQGFAPQYGQGGTGVCYGAGTVCNVVGEGGTVVGNYGGNLPADDSGSLRYVRIAEGGLVAGPNNEINGLTLQGVGYGTTLEYIQVHSNLDDGVEWFGGTVNAKYLVLTGNDDDDIDYDEGYQGNIQYAIIRKNQTKSAPTGSNDPRGIEANSSDEDYTPQTNAAIANVLLIGSTVTAAEPGMRLRGALTTSIYNTALTGWDTGCVRIDDADTDGAGTMAMSDVTLVNVLGDCAGGFYTHETADSETNAVAATVTIDSAYALTDAGATVTAPTITPVANGSGFTFDATTYVGAVAPGTAAADAWWSGWILEGTLD